MLTFDRSDIAVFKKDFFFKDLEKAIFWNNSKVYKLGHTSGNTLEKAVSKVNRKAYSKAFEGTLTKLTWNWQKAARKRNLKIGKRFLAKCLLHSLAFAEQNYEEIIMKFNKSKEIALSTFSVCFWILNLGKLERFRNSSHTAWTAFLRYMTGLSGEILFRFSATLSFTAWVLLFEFYCLVMWLVSPFSSRPKALVCLNFVVIFDPFSPLQSLIWGVYLKFPPYCSISNWRIRFKSATECSNELQISLQIEFCGLIIKKLKTHLLVSYES